MTLKDNLLQQINPKTTIIRMLAGALLGLIIISLFVFSVDDPDPMWGENWRLRPLIITPIATAFGMLSFHLKDLIRPQTNLMNVLVFLTSVKNCK